VITAAIIRVVLTLGAHPSALNVNRWGVRETIVGIITVNIPILRPIISKSFWRTSELSYSAGKGSKSGGHTTTLAAPERGPYELASRASTQSRRNRSFGGNKEFIIGRNSCETTTSLKPGVNDVVVVHTTYQVTSEDAGLDLGANDWDNKGGTIKTVAYRSGNAVDSIYPLVEENRTV
jgi:hypothetical protein